MPPELSVTTPETLAALVPWAAPVRGSKAMIDDATRILSTEAVRLKVHLLPFAESPEWSWLDALGVNVS